MLAALFLLCACWRSLRISCHQAVGAEMDTVSVIYLLLVVYDVFVAVGGAGTTGVFANDTKDLFPGGVLRSNLIGYGKIKKSRHCVCPSSFSRLLSLPSTHKLKIEARPLSVRKANLEVSLEK